MKLEKMTTTPTYEKLNELYMSMHGLPMRFDLQLADEIQIVEEVKKKARGRLAAFEEFIRASAS